ncbi:MAG: heme NO-binding domain-containing protein [Actinomycetota bacterium]
MKGSIFNLFEDFVVTSYGEDVYEDLVDATTLETAGPFVGPGNYPPGDLLALVGTACATFEVDVETLLRGFGRHAFPMLAASVPTLMEGLDTPFEFLLALETLIHTEVRKLDHDADPARFTVTRTSDDSLTLHYESPFGLFALVEGMFDGIGDYFDTELHYERVAVDGTNATFTVRCVPIESVTAGVHEPSVV